MRKFSAVLATTTFFVSMLEVGVPARARGVVPVTYLALGTSLAVGYQPDRDGETPDGYVDVLWRSMQKEIPDLGLRNVGCPGETSRSMINGAHSLCRFAAGSQLDAAVAYLEGHPGQIAFITLEVGANDLIGACLRESWRLDRACAAALLPRLQTRLTQIVDALQAAGPDVPIVAMTYYDPLLGLWGLVPGGRALARADQRVWAQLNAALVAVYEGAGVTVADVGATFRIDDFTDTIVIPGRGPLPANVALTCRWTWFCDSRFGGDPHANGTGYLKIARTFERALQGLSP